MKASVRKSKMLLARGLLAMGICQSFVQSCAARALTCPELFSRADHQSVATPMNPRAERIDSYLRANMRFPQVNMGISLTLLADFLHHPIPIEEVHLRVDDKELTFVAEKMNRAHQAFGVRVATADFVAPHPLTTVQKTRLQRLINSGAGLTQTAVVRTIHLLFPQNPLRRSMTYFAGADSDFMPEEELPGILHEVDAVMLDPKSSERTEKLHKFSKALDGLLASRELQNLSHQYRETIRFDHAEARGEDVKPPPVQFRREEVEREIYHLIRQHLLGVVPEVTEERLREWAEFGLGNLTGLD